MSNRKKTSKLKEKETEWQERIVQVRRVTKVVKGGKKLSFRAILIIGNEKGQVGVGVGKASDVIGAVKKAVTDGKKHLIEISTYRILLRRMKINVKKCCINASFAAFHTCFEDT